jgi:hypothetical protein
MTINCKDSMTIIQLVGFSLYAALEYWLGKTTLTKSSSVLEIILNFLKTFLKRSKNMDLGNANIGNVGHASADLVGGSLILSADASDPKGIVTGKIELKLSAKMLGELIKAKIPGQIDDAIIDLMIVAIEKL